MGGGGSYYDRDVTDSALRTSVGTSSTVERELSRASIDASLLPKDRKLVCNAVNPLVYLFDVTGSMGNLPKIIWDKWPGIVGQIVARKYLPDPKMSLAAVGDITSDNAPLQMADFSALRNLDRFFKKIYFEGQGGGQDMESYEMAAYYYAYLCDLPNAKNPICLFTGDEGFRKKLFADDLTEHFGGKHKDIDAQEVFADLLKKFMGNVFLIHRYYKSGTDAKIVREWQEVLGKNRVVLMPRGDAGDLAIGDITLGLYAIVSGARTLKQYLEDMRTRPLDLGEGVKYEPQSEKRIGEVAEALAPLEDFKPIKSSRTKTNNSSKEKKSDKKPPSKDKGWGL
ncbi:hypothetical protein HY967_03980 [Candidatus Jorgensenbacteria bacterium]|nr:hypothetical protein [Candidatus Jorgensenbacteria bacterium]